MMFRNMLCCYIFIVYCLFGYSYQKSNAKPLIFDLSSELQKKGQNSTGLKLISEGQDYYFNFSVGNSNGRSAEISSNLVHKIASAFQNYSDYSFLVDLNQQRNNRGSLFTFRLDDKKLLSLHSLGERNKIRFTYYPDDSKARKRPRKRRFLYVLADKRWHRFTLSIIGRKMVKLYIDCNELNTIRLREPTPQSTLLNSQLRLFIGQNSDTKGYFEGKMKNIKFVFGSNGHSVQCQAENKAPLITAASSHSTQKPKSSKKSYMASDANKIGYRGEFDTALNQLTESISSLENKVATHEKRLKSLERCECEGKCYSNHRFYSRGDSWLVSPCERCYCQKNGVVSCGPQKCPPVFCSNPLKSNKTCCPYCPKLFISADPDVNLLMENMMNKISQLHLKYLNHEDRIEARESCECIPKCEMDNITYSRGDKWKVNSCKNCTCEQTGKITCFEEKCPTLDCKTPISVQNKCCPKCPRRCQFLGKEYEHEEILSRNCVDCHCQDGSMTCKRRTCPKLNCPRHLQVTLNGNCCKVCKVIDYCSQKPCVAGALCFNRDFSFTCQCPPGYEGDGRLACTDVNECLQSADKACSVNEFCVNMIGSYHCSCRPGYSRPASGSAVCVADPKTSCDPRCTMNGGTCSNNICKCPAGRRGSFCQIDIDECVLGSHKCHPNSQCVNLPGSYYCKCRPGYTDYDRDNDFGTKCQDVDECKLKRDIDYTCNQLQKCVNTPGSYKCACNRQNECFQACHLNRGHQDLQVIDNGVSIVDHPFKKCSICTCRLGVLQCERKTCSCSSTDAKDSECCPECQPGHCLVNDSLNNSPRIKRNNGDRWIDNCSLCTCKNNQTSCVPLTCPPIACRPELSFTPKGECCPQCPETLACNQKSNEFNSLELTMGKSELMNSDSGTTCRIKHETYNNDAQWLLSEDSCVECRCENGNACCRKSDKCEIDSIDATHSIWPLTERGAPT